jgi:hypothetical protein
MKPQTLEEIKKSLGIEKNLYTRQEMSFILQMPLATLRKKIKELKLEAVILTIGYNTKHFYTDKDLELVKKSKRIICTDNIIYVVRSLEIRESISNFYSDAKINTLIKKYESK